MTTILIKIDCFGEYCGECKYQTCEMCLIFREYLYADGKRLPECKAACKEYKETTNENN